jgi:hypothetical protein
MTDYNKILTKIEGYQEKIDNELEKLSKPFKKLLDDMDAHVVIQAGDGIGLLYDGESFCSFNYIDIDYILTLSKHDAINYLNRNQS